MIEGYDDVVVIFPPKKARDGETVLLKFQTRNGETVRLRMNGPDPATFAFCDRPGATDQTI